MRYTKPMKYTEFMKRRRFLFPAGIVLGALIVLVVRFATYMPPMTHYHANFAVYINGQREEFKDSKYYEEVAACMIHGTIQPAQRAHMHDNINSVVHVHDDGVTWDQFFENLGWYVGPDFIETDNGTMYKEDETSKLNIMLNGQNVTGFTHISNVVIGDEDRLLVSFGNIDNKTLEDEYKSVPNTAKKYDESNDPANCAGQMSKVTLSDRLHHLF